MREALAVYTSRAAERLRKARMVANGVTVWGPDQYFYRGRASVCQFGLWRVTRGLGTYRLKSSRLLYRSWQRIFRKGYRYKKAGG